jgi:hypothetical protein
MRKISISERRTTYRTTANRLSANVAKIRYLGKAIANQNLIREGLRADYIRAMSATILF